MGYYRERLARAGDNPRLRWQRRRELLRQRYRCQGYSHRRRSVDDLVTDHRFGRAPPPLPRRVFPHPGGGPLRRQRLLARWLADARRRWLLRQLRRCLSSLAWLEYYQSADRRLEHLDLTPWLRRLEGYDESAEPLRRYFGR